MKIDLIARALQFAAMKHRDQRRKSADASPYINHPIDLMHILAVEANVDDAVVLAAALLHDTIEDTETTIEELRILFGDEVTDIVIEVTDDKTLPKEMRKQLQIEKASTASPKAKLVKLADKVANLRGMPLTPPTGWDDTRIAAYYDWSHQVVAGLRGTHDVLETLFDEAHKLKK